MITLAVKKVMIGLDEDVLKEIDQKAKAEHRSRSNYIEFTLIETNKLKEREKELINRISELEELIKTIPQQSIQQSIKEETKSGFTKAIDNIPNNLEL